MLLSKTYGFKDLAIDDVKNILASTLEIEFTSRYSDYLGGSYYLYKDDDSELRVRRNYDVLEDDLEEVEFPEIPILLRIEVQNLRVAWLKAIESMPEAVHIGE